MTGSHIFLPPVGIAAGDPALGGILGLATSFWLDNTAFGLTAMEAIAAVLIVGVVRGSIALAIGSMPAR